MHLVSRYAHHDDGHTAERRDLIAQPVQKIDAGLAARKIDVGDDQRRYFALDVAFAASTLGAVTTSLTRFSCASVSRTNIASLASSSMSRIGRIHRIVARPATGANFHGFSLLLPPGLRPGMRRTRDLRTRRPTNPPPLHPSPSPRLPSGHATGRCPSHRRPASASAWGC